MNYIAHLIHDDMFLAVVSYLSIGLVCLLYFFYRERKWERDLAQFEIKPVKNQEASMPQYRPGTFSINSNSNKIVVVAALNEEMQVIAGQPLEPELAFENGTSSISPAGHSKQHSATILPFKRVRQRSSAVSRHQQES
jgi:hypothetical protein